MLDIRMQALRAIEALRAGVPNRDAVVALGSNNEYIESEFRRRLSTVGSDTVLANGTEGMLVAGNFGTGKSHLLEYLQQLALEQRFVVSKIVISKETPLHDPVKVYRAAIRSASVPARIGAALTQIASELDFNSTGYSSFYRQVQQDHDLNRRFAATLYLAEYANQDRELLDRIISFWSGDSIQIGDIKRALRQLGHPSMYTFEKASVRQLAYQRFRFAPQLMAAAGYAGWVLLFDEVDLVARYTANQRAKSYAEIARWTGNLTGESYPGIISVMAITSAFESEILEKKNDWDAIPGRLRASHREADLQLAPQAERGMRLITNAPTLSPPADAIIDGTYDKVRSIHGKAYAWSPPPIEDTLARDTTTTMREHIRSWINEWDLMRLFPEHVPSIELTPIIFDYGEDKDLDSEPEDENPYRDNEDV